MSNPAIHCRPSPQQLATLAEVRAGITKRAENIPQSVVGAVWRGVSLQVRTALVMLATDKPGDARTYARRSWDAYGAIEQAAIGAAAREIVLQLDGAAEFLR